MFEQINKALSWLKNNNKINDYQYNVLQDYYRKNDSINVEVLRDELFKLGTDPSFVLSKISEIEDSNIDVIEFDDFNVLNSDYKNDNVSNFSNDITLNTNTNFNNTIPQNTVNQIDRTKSYSNENYIQKELFILKGEYPDAIISLTDTPHQYILSQDGEDKYFNVEGENGIYRIVRVEPVLNNQSEGNTYSNQKRLGTHPALGNVKWGNDDDQRDIVMTQNNKQAAFTNILFFIFLAGLSVGVIFMVILNFFIK